MRIVLPFSALARVTNSRMQIGECPHTAADRRVLSLHALCIRKIFMRRGKKGIKNYGLIFYVQKLVLIDVSPVATTAIHIASVDLKAKCI